MAEVSLSDLEGPNGKDYLNYLVDRVKETLDALGQGLDENSVADAIEVYLYEAAPHWLLQEVMDGLLS